MLVLTGKRNLSPEISVTRQEATMTDYLVFGVAFVLICLTVGLL